MKFDDKKEENMRKHALVRHFTSKRRITNEKCIRTTLEDKKDIIHVKKVHLFDFDDKKLQQNRRKFTTAS